MKHNCEPSGGREVCRESVLQTPLARRRTKAPARQTPYGVVGGAE